MEKRNIVIQELKKSLEDEYVVAQKYYSILSAINNLNLTKREIELIAFTAVKGTISYANSRTQFCEKYNTTTATINNIVSKLKKIGIFVKHLGKIKVNPIIVIDFKKNLNLVIRLVHNEETKKTILKGEINQEDVNQAGSVRDSSKSSDNSPVQ
jgi:protein-arginine kinase activator protein McsA